MILLMPLPATCNVFEINAASARGASPTYRRSGCALYKSTPAEYLSPPRLVLASLFPSEWNTMEEEEEEGGEGSSSWRETIARRGGGRGRSRLSLLLTFHAFYTVVSSVVRIRTRIR